MLVLQRKKGVQFNLKHTLDNPNAYSTSAGDNFGFSADIDSNHAIVGAPFEDDAGGSNSGKAYIFDVTTGNLVHTLDNPNAHSTSNEDRFGYSVAISGNYAIVGAVFENEVDNIDSGKAYIFDVTTGNLVHTLDNPNAYNTPLSDLFGVDVAIDGNKCVVGAHAEDDAGGNQSGKAYVFDVTTGNLLQTLDNPNAFGTSSEDQFAIRVAIKGDIVMCAARLEDDAGGTSSGKAYIFSANTGNLLHTLNNPNPAADAFFGNSVDISHNKCITGAHGYSDTVSNSGIAYIFDRSTGNLLHTLRNPDPRPDDYIGPVVAISGNYAAVGARLKDTDSGTDVGKVYIFDATSGALVQTIDNPSPYGLPDGDDFSFDLQMNGNYCIISSRFEDDAGGADSGKAYIYELS